MNVQYKLLAHNPSKTEFLGCITTDMPEEFQLWLDTACPNHETILQYERTSGAVAEEGGYQWRFNVKFDDRKEALMFKLRWYCA